MAHSSRTHRSFTLSGYKVTKIREESSPNRHGLLFKIDLPEIKDGVRPIRRMMSAFEQRREIPNRAIQYLLVSPAVSLLPSALSLYLPSWRRAEPSSLTLDCFSSRSVSRSILDTH